MNTYQLTIYDIIIKEFGTGLINSDQANFMIRDLNQSSGTNYPQLSIGKHHYEN